MKTECPHLNLKIETHEKTFQGEAFRYESKTCLDCEASLWDESSEKNFNSWLISLHKKKRHLFQIQYGLSQNAIQRIDKISERFPGIDESLLIRALVIINLDIVEENQEILSLVESHLDSEDYAHLTSGPMIGKKLQFKPNGMQEILAYAGMLKVKPSKIIEESINRILLLGIKTDPVLKAFWEETAIKNLETILKAA